MKDEIENGRKQNILNEVISSKTEGGIQAKFGGACAQYLTGEKGEGESPPGRT